MDKLAGSWERWASLHAQFHWQLSHCGTTGGQRNRNCQLPEANSRSYKSGVVCDILLLNTIIVIILPVKVRTNISAFSPFAPAVPRLRGTTSQFWQGALLAPTHAEKGFRRPYAVETTKARVVFQRDGCVEGPRIHLWHVVTNALRSVMLRRRSPRNACNCGGYLRARWQAICSSV